MDLKAAAAVITGGAGHLGTAVTLRFLQEGAMALVPWHSEDKWDALAGSLPEETTARLIGCRTDVTDEGEVEEAMTLAEERFGKVDVLLNLVGGFAFGENIWETAESTWDRMMALNLKSAFLCSKHALRLMRREGRGRIVNVASKAAVDIQPGAAAYAVAKSGVVTLTRALREEVKGTDITANAVMPSIIDTPVTRDLMPDADFETWVTPEQIADALVALCSDTMRAVDGSVLRVFGAV